MKYTCVDRTYTPTSYVYFCTYTRDFFGTVRRLQALGVILVRVLAGVWRLASSGTAISLSTALAVVRLLWASNSRGRCGRKVGG